MSVEDTDARSASTWPPCRRGDFSAFFADDVLWTTMETGDEIRGREAVSASSSRCTRELFDAAPEFGNVTVADGVAALEAVFVGTHIAEFAGVPATGAQVRLPYSVSYDVSDGTITALRAYFPITALIGQLSTQAAADHPLKTAPPVRSAAILAHFLV